MRNVKSWVFICAVLVFVHARPSCALSWRIYSGWDECVTTEIPDGQWELVLQSLRASGTNESQINSVPTAVNVEAGLLVSDEYGNEDYRGSLDATLYDPRGVELKSVNNVQDEEMEAEATGVKGPWKLCFRIHKGSGYRPPSLVLELAYFIVNHRSLVGTSYEAEKSTQTPLPPDSNLQHPAAVLAHHADKEHIASSDQVEGVMENLATLEVHLQRLESEQHHMHLRASRHLKTVQSTHTRTLRYYLAIYAAIVATSFAQVAGVRRMFKDSSGGRLPTSLGRMSRI